MLRLNANVRSLSRTLSNGSARQRGNVIGAHIPGRERLQDPTEDEGLQEEAAEALAHCVPSPDVLASSDGYLTSAIVFVITVQVPRARILLGSTMLQCLQLMGRRTVCFLCRYCAKLVASSTRYERLESPGSPGDRGELKVGRKSAARVFAGQVVH